MRWMVCDGDGWREGVRKRSEGRGEVSECAMGREGKGGGGRAKLLDNGVGATEWGEKKQGAKAAAAAATKEAALLYE